MNSLKILLATTALFSAAPALPISLPVAEDTFTTIHGTLAPANGSAATLLLNTNQAALIKFDLSALPTAFSGTNILSASLKIYIATARTPGDLQVFPITSTWTESTPMNSPIPNFDPTPISTVPAARVLAKRFVIIDVTAEVVAAINGTRTHFGFLLPENAG